MAGPIRQQINLENLEKYVKENVPEIKVPLDVKQVSISTIGVEMETHDHANDTHSLDMGNQTRT